MGWFIQFMIRIGRSQGIQPSLYWVHLLKGKYHCLLTSCFICLDSAALLLLNEQQFHLYDLNQISQTRGPLYRDTSPVVTGICNYWPDVTFSFYSFQDTFDCSMLCTPGPEDLKDCGFYKLNGINAICEPKKENEDLWVNHINETVEMCKRDCVWVGSRREGSFQCDQKKIAKRL